MGRGLAGATARLRGPGGCYNTANLLALAAGMSAQCLAATDGRAQSKAAALRTYFFGDPGATWLTVAVALFLAAGELYHRAWAAAGPPSPRLTQWGDLLSGVGALALALSLASYGNLVLAILSGLLLAVGKLGNAACFSSPSITAVFRSAALLSRIFVLATLTPMLAAAALQPGDAAMALIHAVRTLICCRADYLLMRQA